MAQKSPPLPRRPCELYSIAFLRYALFCFNAIFMMTGLTLLGFGVWTWVEKANTLPLMPTMFSISVYSMTAAGALVVIGCIIGCHGTTQEKLGSLTAFTVLLVIILLVEISTGVLSYLVYAQVSKSSFTEQLSEIAVKQYGEKDSVTAAVDKIHMKYSCCGARYYTDWRELNMPIRLANTTTPDSCCITVAKDCGRIDHPSNLNMKGCSSFIERDIILNIVLIPALSLGFSIIQIFGIVFSCLLIQRIKRSRRFRRKQYRY